MATRTIQPSEYEIQREVEALRDLRRRSAAPGALVIDPDLPNHSPPGSPTYWAPGPAVPSLILDGDSSSSSHEDSSASDLSSGRHESSSNTPDSSETPNNPADDPYHLFWVPANLHPEIAPAEFRAFLKEHARSPPNSDVSDSPQRSNSVSSSSGLARKSSMLSRQYKPRENDGVEEENVVPLRRNRNSFYADRVPQLTMDDLQKLEELAEEATESDDPSKLRTMLRRSLSVNASALDRMDDMPEMTDEADSPIIVPPPGQILRRTARTKIRKPGLPGDGGGHRFGASRRGAPNRTVSANESRTSSDFSASDHGDVEPSSLQRRQTFSDDGYGGSQRPDSFSEEIYDAYRTRDSEEEEREETVLPLIVASAVESQPSQHPQEPPTPAPISEIKPELLEALGPVLHQPQPQRLLVPRQNEIQATPSRSPSPSAPAMPSLYSPPSDSPSTSSTGPSFLSTTPSPPSQQQNRRDKDKTTKKLFGKWGGDKGGKKGKEDSGFFGSLFGGKKKQDEPPPLGGHGVNAGREAAHALLGASKSSKAYTAPPSPGLAPGIGGPNSYARYPIHVERAIYRLSHIKLANPRRPLYEQVLISNLMFWYLGVINKAQNPTPNVGQGGPNGTATLTTANGSEGGNEKEDDEDERREIEQREQQEKAERERLDRERFEKEQREKEAMELRKKESGRKGSLTKTGGPASAGRRAEMPIRGPQYEMQHRVMEQEYHGSQPQQPMHMGRPPQANSGPGQQFPRQQQQQPPSPYGNVLPGQPRPVQSQQQPASPDQFYYSGDVQQQRLPPGAMLPVDQSQRTPQTGMPPKRSTHSSVSPPSTPVPQRRSRSPPPQGYVQQQPMNMAKINSSQDNLIQSSGAAPGIRQHAGSFSAVSSRSPPPQANGTLRKQNSANAVIPGPPRRPHTSEGRPGYNREEEDVPLAVWQQQRRK